MFTAQPAIFLTHRRDAEIAEEPFPFQFETYGLKFLRISLITHTA